MTNSTPYAVALTLIFGTSIKPRPAGLYYIALLSRTPAITAPLNNVFSAPYCCDQ
ncbi:MAG: hypothetical protein IPF58_04265 [Saprospirales bacterium]|nr:hypothetical protein [Saprospirales bacterium]